MSRDSALNGSRINELLAKMREQDMDYRYMALNDLATELQQSDSLLEETVGAKIIDAVLKSLTDTNGEVQNMAVKCLGPLVRRSRDPQIQVVLDRLVKSTAQSDLQDLGSTALRTVILEVQPNSASASTITKKLLPKLIDQLQNRELSSDLVLETIDTLTELLSRFGEKIQNLPETEQNTVIKVCLGFLGHGRPAVRKRTIVALSHFSTKLSVTLFSNLVSNVLQMFTSTREDLLLATLVDLCGQISRAEMECADRNMFSPFLQSLLAPIMDALRHDNDELKESVFYALEAFVLQAGSLLNKFEYEVFDVASNFISYDPNYHVAVETDEDMKEDEDDSDLASDFDEDDDYEDDDDVSWKVRKCAARVLAAMVTKRLILSDRIVQKLLPALLKRFTEREENVRNEILLTFALCIDSLNLTTSPRSSPSRKRARDDDDSMDVETSATLQQVQALLKNITQAVIKQYAGKSLANRFNALKIITAVVQHEALARSAEIQSLTPVLSAAISEATKNHSNIVMTNIGCEALVIIRLLHQNRASRDAIRLCEDTLPYLTPAISSTLTDKLALAAIDAAQAVAKAASACAEELISTDMTRALLVQITKPNIDTEIRNHCLAVIGSVLRGLSEHQAAIINEAGYALVNRIQNDATRSASLSALVIATESSVVVSMDWASSSLPAFTGLLSKSDRNTRLNALYILRNYVSHAENRLNITHVQNIIKSTNQFILSDDMQLILGILNFQAVLSRNVSSAEVGDILIENSLSGTLSALDNSLIETSDVAQQDIKEFLKNVARGHSKQIIEILRSRHEGTTDVRTIATMIGIVIEADPEASYLTSYHKELAGPKTSEMKRTLALYVLGSCATLIDDAGEQLIKAQFDSPSDMVKNAAAYALGNFAAVHLQTALPDLLENTSSSQRDPYLTAVAMKEILIRASSKSNSIDLSPHLRALLPRLFDLASDDRANNVIAECIGRLAILHPQSVLPVMQEVLRSTVSTSRAVVIRAVKYTFTTTTTAFDHDLQPLVTDFMSLIRDDNIEIRRLTLNTLYSAAHNKPELLQDHLATIMPLLLSETALRKDLMQSIQMGPFKHIVDDGLDLRKSAFETLHTMLDTFPTGIDASPIFEIIIRGLEDVQEIKTISLLILPILATIATSQTSTNLDAITEKLMKIMNAKLRDAAVKQDKERDTEIKRAALRCTLSLESCASDLTPGFNAFIADMKATKAAEIAQL